MTKSFRLPDLGEGVHEAEILAVHVVVGQSIKEGDLILEVETDKAVVEIPSPITGDVREVLVQKGDMAKVGDVLINFVEAADTLPAAVPEPPKSLAGQEVAAAQPLQTSQQPVPASPATRRLARELGVDLQQVNPTGAGGVVSADDVRSFAAAKKTPEELPAVEHSPTTPTPAGTPSAASLPDFSQWGPIIREPFRSIRRATAAQMTSSWSRIPHVNCQDSVDITRLEAFRQRHKAEIEAAGGRLTMTIFAMKAVATALKNYPHFNASLDLASQEIIVKQYFHIGIAVDTEHGLMVPVIRDVDRKSIKELAIELHGAIERARLRKNSREEMLGGSFTITNVGGLGGSYFSAIINHPEVAILGLGQGRMQPAVVTNSGGEPEIVPRLLMPIVLCFDHRVVDGADAIRFLRQVIDVLEDPDELFITMI
ncbi:MAG: dihydrolipoamide acetyltransferase family protein [Desulfoprunum sp.]|nr:dihydrolipoamide acetyltransferase family protein [Desulfoprunum sp.]